MAKKPTKKQQEQMARAAADFLASSAGAAAGSLVPVPGAAFAGQYFGPEIVESLALHLAGRPLPSPQDLSPRVLAPGQLSPVGEMSSYQKLQELIFAKQAFQEGYAAAKGFIAPSQRMGPLDLDMPTKQKRKVSRVQKAFGKEMKAIKKKTPNSYLAGRNKKKLMRLAWAAVNKRRKKEKW